MHSITNQPVQAITVQAKETLYKNRFVNHLGSLCRQDQKALGVSELNWNVGELASVVSLGTIAVETATTIYAGDNVVSDNNGRAKTAGGGSVNGRAMESTTGADIIKIVLVP